MLLADNYILFLASGINGTPNKIVLYEVQSVLDLLQSDEMMVGHPSKDLPKTAWGTVDFNWHKIQRWVKRGRMVKARLNPGGSIRVTYAEPREWTSVLTVEQIAWLEQICDVSGLYNEEIEHNRSNNNDR